MGGSLSTNDKYALLCRWWMAFWDFPLFLSRDIFPPKTGKITRKISYGSKPHNKKVLDVFQPPGNHQGKPRPIIIAFHGGGWVGGDRSSIERTCRHFASSGFLTFNVNYLLAPEFRFPSAIEDGAEALEKVLEIYPELGGDGGNIFLWGDSAGAFVASLLASAIKQPELFEKMNLKKAFPQNLIRGLLLFYGIYNLQTLSDTKFSMVDVWRRCSLGEDPEVYKMRAKTFSPIIHVSDNFPPVYLSSGEIDRLHTQSLEYLEALNRKEIKTKTCILTKEKYPLANHAYMNVPFMPWSKKALDQAVEFIRAESVNNFESM